jgi:hypothetical protein
LLFLAGNSKTMNDWVELINKVLVLDEPKPKTPEKVEVPKPQEQNIQISETLPKVPSQRLTRPIGDSKTMLNEIPVQQYPPSLPPPPIIN